MKPPPPAEAPLEVEDYREATVMPVTPHVHRRPATFRFGVFNKRGKIVRRSLLIRSYGRQGFPAEYEPASRTDSREVVFGGNLVNMYGHFLLEGLARLWYARAHPELPIVWACRAGAPAPTYRRWHHELLDVVGIRNEAIFLTEPTRFKRVWVPHAGYRIKDWCSDQYAEFLAVYPERPRDPDLKLWLSRAEVHGGQGSTFAFRLDRQLAEHGWTIARMEKLHVHEQLELLATASRVAGEEGSAFHSLALLSDVSGLEVDIVGRRPNRAVELQNQNYETVARARGIEQRIHVIPEEWILFEQDNIVRKVATTIAGHLEVAGVARAEVTTPARTGTWAVRIGHVAEAVAAGACLEVGADPGEPDPEPTVDLRDIVRPTFVSDPRQHDHDGQRLYEMPPEEFFDFCADLARRYDVIHLDAGGAPGLLWRWFVASRRHAHEGTIWVLTGSDEELPAEPGPGLESTAVTTPDGPCLLVTGPAVDAAAVDAALTR